MRATPRVVAGLGLLLALPAGAGVLAAGATGAPAASTTGVDIGAALLTTPVRGRAAVDALGADLDVAATRSGLSTGTLRELLAADRSAWVDETGRLFYVEPDQTTDPAAPPTEAARGPVPVRGRRGELRRDRTEVGAHGSGVTGLVAAPGNRLGQPGVVHAERDLHAVGGAELVEEP